MGSNSKTGLKKLSANINFYLVDFSTKFHETKTKLAQPYIRLYSCNCTYRIQDRVIVARYIPSLNLWVSFNSTGNVGISDVLMAESHAHPKHKWACDIWVCLEGIMLGVVYVLYSGSGFSIFRFRPIASASYPITPVKSPIVQTT